MNISTLKKNGFTGCDVNLNVSLFEYGFIFKQFKRTTKNFKKNDYLWFGVVTNDDGIFEEFDWCCLSPHSFYPDFVWIEMNMIYLYTGLSKNEWDITPFEEKINTLMSYYGLENVFGSIYQTQKIGGYLG